MCGGSFSGVTHPYIHINHILYIGVGVWGLKPNDVIYLHVSLKHYISHQDFA